MKNHFSFPFSWQILSLWAILGLSFLGQFARIDTAAGRLSLHEIVLVPVIATTLWFNRSQLWLQFRRSKVTQFALLFLLWATVTTLWNSSFLGHSEFLLQGFAYLARLALYLGFALSVRMWYVRKEISAQMLRFSVLLWLFLQACVGIVQYLLLPDTRIFFFLGWDDHLSRAFGTLFDPGFFGLLMVFGAVLSFAGAVRVNGSPRAILTFAGSFFLSALALSYSRASYVSFVSATVVLAFLWRQRKALLFIPLFVLCLVLLPKDGGGEGQNLLRTRSIEAREEVLQNHARALSIRELLIGKGWYYAATDQRVGQDGSELRNNSHSVDNVYLHILFSTGIIGAALFTTWLILVLWSNRSSPEFLAIWSAVLMHSLFSPALLYSWVMLVLAVFVNENVRSD